MLFLSERLTDERMEGGRKERPPTFLFLHLRTDNNAGRETDSPFRDAEKQISPSPLETLPLARFCIVPLLRVARVAVSEKFSAFDLTIFVLFFCPLRLRTRPASPLRLLRT